MYNEKSDRKFPILKSWKVFLGKFNWKEFTIFFKRAVIYNCINSKTNTDSCYYFSSKESFNWCWNLLEHQMNAVNSWTFPPGFLTLRAQEKGYFWLAKHAENIIVIIVIVIDKL